MSKKWTRRERREHLKEKYFGIRKKVWVLIAFAALFIILAYSIYHLLNAGGDVLLLGLLVIIFLVLIPIAVFFVDLLWYEFG